MRHEFILLRPVRRFQSRAESAMVDMIRNVDEMSPDFAPNANEPLAPAEALAPLRVADYLWRPWYAKLWWSLIPVYWIGAAASSALSELAQFYDSALAGYLNILFLPLTAIVILGFGYARAWLDRAEWVEHEGNALALSLTGRQPGVPPPEFDTLDPRSGFLWINHPRNRERRRGR